MLNRFLNRESGWYPSILLEVQKLGQAVFCSRLVCERNATLKLFWGQPTSAVEASLFNRAHVTLRGLAKRGFSQFEVAARRLPIQGGLTFLLLKSVGLELSGSGGMGFVRFQINHFGSNSKRFFA